MIMFGHVLCYRLPHKILIPMNRCFANAIQSSQIVNPSSSLPVSIINQDISTRTGAFKTVLPEVYEGPTHYKKALRQMYKVEEKASIKNIRNRQRKYAAQSLDELMKGLTVPITNVLKAYNIIFKRIHPYEATVASLTVIAREKKGKPGLEDTLERLKLLRAKTSKLAKDFASRANNASSAVEAKELLKAGTEALQELYENPVATKCMDDLLSINKDLRRIPIIDLSLPTVVLLGSPNVGKSSIVRAVSTGTPEVNDYPFTTRGVSIGHILDRAKDFRFQVMDTPGLLDRPEEERNEMEKLTYASLAHLPTAAIFVIDHSGLSGEKSTLQAQLNVRATLKARFPRRPWLDVISKGDLPICNEVQQLLPKDALIVSVKSGYNIDVLKNEIQGSLMRLSAILASSATKN